jgi:teichuronic acid biosynthesis glycosyltransferase TuaG
MEGTGRAERVEPAPRVTVIVPAHNAERFLPEALDSVLAQSYPQWEAVVADDASSDRTREIAALYAARHPRRISVVEFDSNSGPAVARNEAIAASNGTELIALLDADDRWRCDYLERMVALYDEATTEGHRVGIVACNALLETPEGIADETFADRFGWAVPVTYEGMIERSTIFVGAVIPRAAYDEVGGFSPECWGSEDYDLWLRIMERGYEVVSTPEPLAIYRYHAGGLSRSELTMADAGIAAYRRALERAVSRRWKRAIRKRLRHYRALRARALLRDAIARRSWVEAAQIMLESGPVAAAAVLQTPKRWREWARDLVLLARG